MTPEPKNPKSGIAGRLNMAGWRKHYVAAMTADEEAWPRREPGSNLGRIFIILLLLHGFLIGAVVLYNVISPKSPPAVATAKPNLTRLTATALTTSASVSAPMATGNMPAAVKPPVTMAPPAASPKSDVKFVETGVYEVRSGDNVPGIAAALGVAAVDLIKLNNLDNTELYPGRKLSYPKKPAAPVLRALPVPSIAASPKSSPPENFKAVTTPKESTPPVKLKDNRAITGADSPPKTPAAKTTAQTADQPPASRITHKNEPSGGGKSGADSQTNSPKPLKTAVKSEKSSKPESTPKTAQKTEKSSKETAGRRSHIVGPKETLYSIARKYGVKVDALQKANGIKDPTTLRDGMKLTIPSKN